MEQKRIYHARQQLDSYPCNCSDSQDPPAANGLHLEKSAYLRASLVLFFVLSLVGRLNAQGPGGVSSNLQLWLKANVGASNNSWSDQINSNNFTDKVGTGTITFENTELLNFNPVMRFPGSAGLRVPGTVTGFPTSNASRYLFSVIRNASAGGDEYIFQYGDAGGFGTAYGQFISTGKYGVDYGENFVSTIQDYITGTTATDFPEIFMSHHTGSAEGGQVNGTNQTSAPRTGLNNNLTYEVIGGKAQASPINYFNGDIAEILLYTGTLSATNQQKITSYLALKYGVTLTSGTVDYLASNGTTKMWDSGQTGTGGLYKEDIAGIGKDDDSALSQPKSKSQNSDAIVTIEAESTIGNLEFLSWANNNATASEGTAEISGDVEKRLTREWLVQENNTDVGNVTVSFDLSGISISGNADNDFLLLIDTDGNFGDGNFTTKSGTYNSSSKVVTFTGVNLSDGDYITIATQVKRLLSFTVAQAQQPTDNEVNESISPVVKVAIVDAGGVVQTDRTDQITLAFNNDPSMGSAGITGGVVSAVNGIATFSSLSIDEIGDGYTLRATSNAGALETTSTAFEIFLTPIDVSGTGTLLSGTNLSRTANGLEAATITVQLKDAAGNDLNRSGVDLTFATTFGDLSAITITTNASGQATVTLTSTNTGTAEVTAMVDHDNDNGTAQVLITRGSPISATFNPGPATKLSFTAEPVNTFVNTTLGGAQGIEVSVLDANDNLVTTATTSITVNVDPLNDPSGGADPLNGTQTKNAVSGVASFTDLTIDVNGDAYKLKAEGGALAEDISDAFNVSTAPGGVGVELRYWFDARDMDADGTAEGTSESGHNSQEVNTWKNKTGGVDLTDNVNDITNSLPKLLVDQINHNAALQFIDGASDYLVANVMDFPTTKISQFLVFKANSYSGADSPYSYASSSTSRSNEFTLFLKSGLIEVYAANLEQREYNEAMVPGKTELLSIQRSSISETLYAHREGVVLDDYSAVNDRADNALGSEGYYMLGQDQDGIGTSLGNDFDGQIAEVITYADSLNDTDRQKVESYLAIKYGITLDQTSGIDYLASNGIAVWDADENSTYKHDIAGIGKDDNSGLNQVKSKSENAGTILTIESNSGTIANGKFMIWGHNGNASTATVADVTINDVKHIQMSRVWRIQEKEKVENGGSGVGTASDLGAIDLIFDLTGITYTEDRVRLLLDDDGTFGTETTSSTGTFNGDVVTFSNVAVTDGHFISLAVDFTPKLSFSEQPTDAIVNGVINASTSGVVVQALDANDMVVTDFTSIVSLALSPCPTCLSGLVITSAVAGVTTYPDLKVNQVGTYNLMATSGSLDAVVSNNFDITAAPGGVASELRYWFDANDLDADGTAEGTSESGHTSQEVNTWKNKTGGFDLIDNVNMLTNTRPEYAVDQINSNPALRFHDSGTDYLGVEVDDFPTTEITQFLVMKAIAYTGDDTPISYAAAGFDNEFTLFLNEDEIKVYASQLFQRKYSSLNLSGDTEILTVSRNSTNSTQRAYRKGQILTGSVERDSQDHIALLESGYYILGRDQDSYGGGLSNDFDGHIAEVITYADELSDTDRQKVESYLAIKYGITLDQTSGIDYLASNGVAVWDADENSTYKQDIAGIGKDDNSGLNQVKSKSENAGTILTIESNSGTIADGKFMIWGHNGNVSTATVADVIINDVKHTQMSRVWRIQEKEKVENGGSGVGTASDLGTVNLSFDLSGVSDVPDRVRLLIDDDGTFGAGTTVSTGTFNGDVVTFSNVAVTDGHFISLAVDFTPKLSFSEQPTDAIVNGVINASTSGVVVQALDANDMVVTDFTSIVSLALSPCPTCLSGLVITSAVAGVTTYPDLKVNQVGTYNITATSGSLDAVVSNNFDITAAPGGVASELRLWLKANDGVIMESPIQGWTDKSENGVIATPNMQPTLVSNNFNFNPSVSFDGADSWVTTDLDITANTYPDLTVIVVYSPDRDMAGGVWGGDDGAWDRFLIDDERSDLRDAISDGTNPPQQNLTTLFPVGEIVVGTVVYDESVEDGSFGFANGQQVALFTSTIGSQTSNPFQLGNIGWSNTSGDHDFEGDIAEAIVLSAIPTSLDRFKIESYLAIKYGLTLSTDSDSDGAAGESLGTFTEGDYLNSGDDVMWDYSENTAYSNDIAGIVRDDNAGLNQKQSRSSNADRIVTIGLDDAGLKASNLLNQGSFASDKSSLIWSNDNAALDAPKGSPAHDQIPNGVGVNSRLNRQWRVQETGTVGTVNIQFKLNDLPSLDAQGDPTTGTNDEGSLVLLVSKTEDFTSGSAMLEVVSQSFEVGGDDIANFRHDFSDGDFFTLGTSELVALPIKLISFEAVAHADHVLLEWTTASEENHDFFRIDRAGPELVFEPAGFLESSSAAVAENGFRNYSLKDDQPNEGPNYYRLVDVDLGGFENYSKLIRVNYNLGMSGEYQEARLKVRPNPVRTGQVLELDLQASKGAYHLQLYDGQGTKLLHKKGFSEDNDFVIAIATAGLSSGIYVVKVTGPKRWSVSQKIIVKD